MNNGYKQLDKAGCLAIIDAQVEQFERELFGQRLNLARLATEKQEGVDVGEMVASVEASIAVIERAIATTAAEADKLNGGGKRG